MAKLSKGTHLFLSILLFIRLKGDIFLLTNALEISKQAYIMAGN